MTISADIENISLLLSAINVIFSIKIIRKKPNLRWFEMSLIWAFLIQILAHILAELVGNNMPLLHLYTLLEFVFISLFYKDILFKNYNFSRYFNYALGLVVVMIIYNSIFIEPLDEFNSNAKGLTQAIIISYAIIYFFNRISIDLIKNNLILNRINAAIILYYSGSLFIFVFAKFLMENSLLINEYFWEFNALLYLTFQILILIATWRIVFPKSTNIRE
jgi:hypothetical protein